MVYTYGVRVLWTLTEIDLTPGLRALANPCVARVAIADPRVAPYGRATLQAIQAAKLTDKKLRKNADAHAGASRRLAIDSQRETRR